MTAAGVTFYDVGGKRLEAAWYGPRDAYQTPFVLLHEGLGSLSQWRNFPALLAARTGRAVFAASRYGYGHSTPLGEPRDVDYMHREAIDALPALLDAAEISRAILFGHSDGGSIALIAAAAIPERVAGVVAAAPHVIVEDLTVASIAAVRERWHAGELEPRYARHHADARATFFGWSDIWLDPRFRAWDITPLLPRISAPLLVIQGTADEFGTARQAELIAASVPTAQVTMLAGTGHSPHRERTDEVLALAAAFAEQIDGGRPPAETFPDDRR